MHSCLRYTHQQSEPLIQRNECYCQWDNFNVGLLQVERLAVLERMIASQRRRIG